MAYYLGVDLGLTGAIAMISTEPGVQPIVRDMPVTMWTDSKKRKRRSYNAPMIIKLLEGFRIKLAGVEAVHAMPKHMGGSAAAFSLGMAAGLFEMLFAFMDIKHHKLAPTSWKRYFKLTARDKGKSRVLAARLFPGVLLGNRVDEGKAEALLIAEYMRLLDTISLDSIERSQRGSSC